MLRPTVFVLENCHCKFANFVAPLTNGTAKRLLRCEAQPVLGHRELRCNRNSTGDAMVAHIARKVLQIWGSEVDGSLWRHLSRRENRNIGAQPQSLACTTAPKIIRKIYYHYDFWCAISRSLRAIFGLPVRNMTTVCCRRYIPTSGKNSYRCTSSFAIIN